MMTSQSWQSPFRSHWFQQSPVTGSQAQPQPAVQASTQITLSTLSLSLLATTPMVGTHILPQKHCFNVAIFRNKLSEFVRLCCDKWFIGSAKYKYNFLSSSPSYWHYSSPTSCLLSSIPPSHYFLTYVLSHTLT